MAEERINVAGVSARLSFDLDSSGAHRFEEQLKQARAQAARPIEAELDVHVKNDEAFNIYARKLREAEARAGRKAAYQASLGADFDAKAFNAAERELASARRKSAANAITDAKAEAEAVARARAGGAKDLERQENERIAVARRGADQRIALVDDLVAAVRDREEGLSRATRAIDAADTADRIRRASERTTAEIAEGERRVQAARNEEDKQNVARERGAQKRLSLLEDLLGTIEADEKRSAAITRAIDEGDSADRVRRANEAAVAADRAEHEHTKAAEKEAAARKQIADKEFEDGKRRRQIARIDEARGSIPLLKRVTGTEKVTTKLGFEVDDREFLVYEAKLREAENLASRKEKYRAHLGADFDEGAFKAAEGEFAKLARSADDAADSVGGGGGGKRKGSNLGASFFFLRGSLERIAQIAALVGPALAAIASEVVALVASLTAAVAGIGALGIGLLAALGPVGLVIGAFVKRASLLTQAWKATSTASVKSGVDAQAAATRQRHAAEQIAAAQRGVQTAHDGVRSAERQLADSRKGVQSAEKQLADAHDNVAEAQDGLTDANFKARREMEDLRREVERTATSEKRANLSLEEALTRLRQIQDDPHHKRDDLLDARLAVEEAKAAAQDAATAHKRAAQDSKRGTDTVTNAQKQLKAAREGVASAEDGVAKAQEGVKTAAEGVTKAQEGVRTATEGVRRARLDAADAIQKESAASNTAMQKLGVLSKEEKSFLAGFKTFLDVFSKAMRPATDAIFGSLGRAFKTTAPLLRDFSGTFVGIGKEIGKVIEAGAKSLASPAWRSALHTFADTGTHIIKPLSGAIGSFFEVIRNIAVAAQPLVRELADNINKWFGGLAHSTGNVQKTRDYIRELVKHTKDWVTWLGQVLRLVFNVFTGSAEQGRNLLNVWTRILRKWNDFLETKEGRAEVIKWFKDAHTWSNRIWVLIKGIAEGFIGMAKHFVGIANFFGGLAGDLLNIKEGTSGIETIGKVLGGLALLKLAGVTKLFGAMLAVGKGAKGIATAVAAFSGLKALTAASATKGGTGSKILDLFKGRGDTMAKPLYVWDVSPKGHGGPGVGGGKGPGGEPVPIGRFPKIKAIAKFAGKAGAAAAAIDFAVHLVDSKGNPIAAAINSVHDLTFGITPKVSTTNSAIKKFNDQLGDLVAQKNVRGLQDLAAEFKRYDSFPGGINKARGAIDKAIESIETSRKRSRSLAREVASVNKEVSGSWRDMAHNTHLHRSDINRRVDSNTRLIRQHLDVRTKEGKEALAKNFQGAVRAVQRQMHRGEVSTGSGMKAIRGYLRQELRAYGLNLSALSRGQRQQVVNAGITHGSEFQVGEGLQRGGWIGGKGQVGPDDVQIAPGNYAARGEYLAKGPGGGAVINRHQAPFVDLALMRGGYSLDTLPQTSQALPMIEAALGDVGGLGSVFASITRPHMMASGGMIQAAQRLEKAHFPYVWGGGHSKSPAPFGPMDCSGAVSYVLQQGGVKIPTMTSGMLAHSGKSGPGPVTVFANPEHTFMRIGRRYFGTSASNPGGGAGWMPDPGEEYRARFTQRHFDGAVGMARIPRVRIRGGGLVGRNAQASLDVARGGAQRQINKLGVGTGDVGDAGPGAQPGVVAAFRRAIAAARANPKERLGLWEAGIVESGLRNLRSGDADSLGALQERVSIYGRAHALSPYASATRFLRDAISRRPFGGSAGMLAAAVQRPRADLRGRYDEARGQARQYFKSGGAYSIGRLRARNKDRIADFDNIMGERGQVAIQMRKYEVQDRRYDLSDEVLVRDDGSLDEKAVKKRANELKKLMDIRHDMIEWLEKALVIARRVVKTYSEIISRLRRSRRHAKGKDRSGITAQIADFVGRRVEWHDKVTDVRHNIEDAKLDQAEVRKERHEVLGTKETTTQAERDKAAADAADAPTPLDFIDAEVATAALTPDKQDDIAAAQHLVDYWKDQLAKAKGTPDPRDDTEAANALGSALSALEELKNTDSTGDTQAALDALKAANEALAANLATANANFAVLTGSGDLGTGLGNNAYWAAYHDATMPVGVGTGMVVGPGGQPPVIPGTGQVSVTVNQNNLVPGSAETLRATGDAVAIALSSRGFTPSRTQKVG